jgi:hypothetical protein
MLDLLGEHRDLGVVEFLAGAAGLELGDQHLGAVMLDIGFLDHVLFDLALAGGIEDFLFDDGVNRQLGADLGHQPLLLLGALGCLELGEQVLDLAMIGFQEGDCVGGGGDGHW